MKNLRVLWGAFFVALAVTIFAFTVQSLPKSDAAQAPASQKPSVEAPATNVAAAEMKSECGDCDNKEACPQKEKGACPIEAAKVAAKAEGKVIAETATEEKSCCASH